MKQNKTNSEKLNLFKQTIANLSQSEMKSILGGNVNYEVNGTIGGKTKSTAHELTCTWCTHTSNPSEAGTCDEAQV